MLKYSTSSAKKWIKKINKSFKRSFGYALVDYQRQGNAMLQVQQSLSQQEVAVTTTTEMAEELLPASLEKLEIDQLSQGCCDR